MKANLRNRLLSAAIGAAVLTLAACASTPANNGPGYPPSYAAYQYGVVESVEMVNEPRSSGPGLGAVAGAVVGGVIGHQIGSGRGNTAATVAGAVGGAVAGNEIEKRNAKQAQVYQARVRLDNGSYQMFTLDGNPESVRVGDRVRIDNGRLYRQ